MDSSRIEVLIADDVAETRDNIRKLLEFEEDICVVGEAADGNEALRLAQELQPDCILMDINMPGLDGIRATERIYQVAPDCLTIVISVQGEQEYLRKAMLAGARDYLVKPFTGYDLVNTIRQVFSLEQARRSLHQDLPANRSAQVIVVFSAKGGVGKTTIATNLAVSLCKQQREVILIDLDLQFGDVPLFLNLKVKRSMADWHHDGREAIDDYLLKHESGLRVLASPQAPEQGELITGEHISQMITELKPHADYVVVDTPQFFHETTLQSLELAHRILLVATPDLPNLKNVKSCLDVLAKLNMADKVWIVANKAGANGIKVEQFSSYLQQPVWQRVPYDLRLATQAAIQGVPAVELNPRSALSKSLVRISKGVLEQEPENSPAGSKAPLTRMLFARR
ncbi:MAG: response regulator/pilus assembly protein [Firmicutes bacterium]|jgi:pilus assembly protein CpaE|nr:response regulator [Bacillota bacterium]NLL87993.1 response regulator/pilus assembly protein [Bacillota bacterium]HKM17017.1 response regulator [Limnochordia bacterium]